MSRLFALCALSVSAVCACACQEAVASAPDAAIAAERDATPIDAEVAARWIPVRAAAGVHSFEATGKLLAPPDARSEVTLPVSASIVALRVAPGERVRAGQVLADVVILEAARARGQLEGAQLRAAALSGRLAQLEELRSEGLARGAELADARARLAEANASAREAEVLLGSLAHSGLRRQRDDYAVVAPLAGVVLAVNAPLGSTRGPSDGPICVISSGAVTRVEARFGFALPAGAEFELWSSSRKLGALKLVAQAPEVSASDATRVAWFDLTQPAPLAQGSLVRVRMKTPDDSWIVPRAAIGSDATPSVLTQARGRVAVAVLTEFGEDALVRGGLRQGDVIAEHEATP